MSKLLPTLGLGVAVGIGLAVAAVTPVLAADEARCASTPRDKWLPEATIRSKVADLGYEVRKIEAEKGCYEVKATDKNGTKVEIYVDPASGEIVKPGKAKDKS